MQNSGKRKPEEIEPLYVADDHEGGCLNDYRACCRGRSKAEFIAKLGDCSKELDETAYWLELLVGEELLSARLLTPLREETRQLVAIFVASMNRAKSPD